MNLKLMKEWIFALRSGMYPNNSGVGFMSCGSYCASGVLGAIQGYEKRYRDAVSSMVIDVSPIIHEWENNLGLPAKEGKISMLFVENGRSFTQLANYLEATYLPKEEAKPVKEVSQDATIVL